MTYNTTTGQLKTPHPHFALSSFLGCYCFTDEKSGGIKYYEETEKEEAKTKAIDLSWRHSISVSLKPVQGRFVIMLNL